MLIFDYFTLILIKNIETNLPKRKNIQKDEKKEIKEEELIDLIQGLKQVLSIVLKLMRGLSTFETLSIRTF